MSHLGAVRRPCRLSFSPFLIAMLAVPGGLLFAPAALAAEPAPVFGRAGQVVLPELMGVRAGVPAQFSGLGVGSMGLGPTGTEVGWGGIVGYAQSAWQQDTKYPDFEQHSMSESKAFWVAPSVDVFVGRGVSLGVSVGYAYTEQRVATTSMSAPWDYTSSAVGASPRIGYVVPIARGLSFWPRLSVSAAYSEQAVSGDGSLVYTKGKSAAFSGGLDLGLVYQPIQRLLFKVSPQINVGRTFGEAIGPHQASSNENMFVRVGGEATVGLVF